jgi:hypothetical protein
VVRWSFASSFYIRCPNRYRSKHMSAYGEITD